MNPALEARTRCVDPTTRPMVEAHVATHETVKQVKSDWAAADSTAGLTLLDDGGVRLSDTIVTLIENTTSTANLTDLNRTSPFLTALLEWDDATSPELELQRIALYLAPRASGAASLEVARWKLELYRIVDGQERVPGLAAVDGDVNTGVWFALAPLADPLEMTIAGEAAGLVVFDYTSRHVRPTAGPGVTNLIRPFNPFLASPTVGVVSVGKKYTVFFVYALRADGSAAGNVGWAYDATKATVTSGALTLRGRRWVTSSNNPGRFQDTGTAGGTPRMKLEIGNYTNATIAFTGAGNKPDLVAAPSGDVQLILRGATPVGTSLTGQVRNDADSAWVSFTDGQFMTADLGLTPTQTRKMQVLLATNGAANLTPTLRGLGMREVTVTDLSDVATAEGGGWAVDPVELQGTIPEVTVRAIHDGERDYRDALSELLATTDIGKLTLRLWWGDKALPKSQWLHLDDLLIDASHPGNAEHALTCLTPLVLLRDLLPKYEPGENVAPDGDSSVGTWTTDAGGGTNLYQRIDEAIYDDTDFIQSVADPVNAAYEATFGTPVDPVGRTHYVEYRYRKDVDAGKTIDLTIELRQGAVVKSTTVHTNIPGPDPGLGWQAGSFALTDDQVASITDYTDLRVRFSANVTGAGGSRKAQVSWARLRIGGKREAPAYVNTSLKDTYDDLIANQLEVDARYRGPGVEDDTTIVAKDLGDAPPSERIIIGKREVDAICNLADGGLISSQGRLKFVRMFQEQGVVAHFPSTEIVMLDATPGYEQRVPEFFALYRWDPTAQTFDEVRGFNDTAIVALGNARLDPPRQLDQEIAKWIQTQSLAEHVADRTIRALGLGLLLWRFRSLYAYPELEPGDVVTIETDQFIARDPNAGRALRGALIALGVIQAVHDVAGTEFSLWIRGYQDVGTTTEQANQQAFAVPTIVDLQVQVRPGFPPIGIAQIRTVQARSVKVAASMSGYPSAATVQAAAATTTDGNGNVVTGSLGTLPGGQVLYVSAFGYENVGGTGAESALATAQTQQQPSPQLQPVVSQNGGSFFTYASGGDTNGFMWIAWTWVAQSLQWDASTSTSIPAASTQLTAPATPTVSAVAGGALGSRTRKVRVGFVKNKTVMNISGEASIVVGANQLLKVTAPTDPGLGYDGWFPMVGAVANTEWTQPAVDPFNPIAFGTDWTEPVGGATVVAGTGTLFDAAQIGAMTSMGLNQTTTYKFYPYWDVAAARIIPQQAVTAADLVKAAEQHATGHVAVKDGAVTGSTPAAGSGGSGSDGGGRYL